MGEEVKPFLHTFVLAPPWPMYRTALVGFYATQLSLGAA